MTHLNVWLPRTSLSSILFICEVHHLTVDVPVLSAMLHTVPAVSRLAWAAVMIAFAVILGTRNHFFILS